MTEWQSLSIRRGLAEPDGPFEGIPRHLLRPLWQWSERYLGGETRGPARDMMLSKIANQLRIDTGNGFRGDPPLDGVLTAEAINGPDRFLDIVDFHLHLTGELARQNCKRISKSAALYGESQTMDFR